MVALTSALGERPDAAESSAVDDLRGRLGRDDQQPGDDVGVVVDRAVRIGEERLLGVAVAIDQQPLIGAPHRLAVSNTLGEERPDLVPDLRPGVAGASPNALRMLVRFRGSAGRRRCTAACTRRPTRSSSGTASSASPGRAAAAARATPRPDRSASSPTGTPAEHEPPTDHSAIPRGRVRDADTAPRCDSTKGTIGGGAQWTEIDLPRGNGCTPRPRRFGCDVCCRQWFGG